MRYRAYVYEVNLVMINTCQKTRNSCSHGDLSLTGSNNGVSNKAYWEKHIIV